MASVELERELPERLTERLNSLLPRDVAVRTAEPAPEDFDARSDARSRTYCYRVLLSSGRDPFEEGRALWWPREMDLDALHACADAVAGRHDFTAFTPTETEHVRFEREVLRSEWSREAVSIGPAGGALGQEGDSRGGVWSYWIEADAFMRHMVRVLVGTMLEVGAGKRSADDFCELLAGAPRERAGETAPPHGLYLAEISY